MTVRCTVCSENFKAWSDGEDTYGRFMAQKMTEGEAE